MDTLQDSRITHASKAATEPDATQLNLARIRQLYGLSISAAARAIGVDRRTLRDLERGFRATNGATWLKVVAFYTDPSDVGRTLPEPDGSCRLPAGRIAPTGVVSLRHVQGASVRRTLSVVPGSRDEVDHESARRDFARRFHDLAVEGAAAEWATPRERASWRRTAASAAREAGSSHLTIARPS